MRRATRTASGSGQPTAAPRPLLEDATASPELASSDWELRAAVAKDTTRTVEERVASFDELYDSEVGDTALTRARNVERSCGLRQLYLKFEGGNPTGTQKDRIAFAQAMDALRRGYDAVTVATCGNYGAAMAVATAMAGLRCLVYVPEGYHTKRIAEMTAFGATILRVPGDYENAVETSRAHAERDELYDANPGGANTALQLWAYGEIAYEIYDDLRDAPAVVAVPASNGTTLAGIHRGFLSLFRRGRTSRMPRFVAGSSYNKNPIVAAFRKGLDRCEDLVPDKIRETAVNEPLVNWRSLDGDLALEALRDNGGTAGYASDRKLTALSRTLREREGLHVLPAATAGLHALLQLHAEAPLPGDRYVAVLTGRKG